MRQDLIEFLFTLAGIILLFVIGHFLIKVVFRFVPWTKAEGPKGVSPEDWLRVLTSTGSKGGTWIGRLESLLVYLVVLHARDDAGLVIGGWLAFKVASKWETWANVIKVPEILNDTLNDREAKLDYLRARRDWSNLLYERFLIGTLLNILLGASVAYLVAWLISTCGTTC
jgi:hypothetical protein